MIHMEVRTQIDSALRGPLDDIEARVCEHGSEVDRALDAATLTRAVADARVLPEVEGDTRQRSARPRPGPARPATRSAAGTHNSPCLGRCGRVPRSIAAS
jgi:hypothetical protein